MMGDAASNDKQKKNAPCEHAVLHPLGGSESQGTAPGADAGNPNFLATIPRHGFFQFGRFAVGESENAWGLMPEGLGGIPRRKGIEGRFDIFTQTHMAEPGVGFIRNAVAYVRDHLGIDAEIFIHRMCNAVLGCEYPTPARMLPLVESIVGHYLRKEMIDLHPYAGEFDLFAVEGGTAAMSSLFHSLRENRILSPGDRIALGQPMPVAYAETPRLEDYRLETIAIDADGAENWQYPNTGLDKLLDPEVKAFLLVNPSSPSSVKLSDDNLRRLQKIVTIRSDLIIITDDTYGTFADNFTSLFAACPRNTILVYSYSRYFGAAGWRMGLVAMHRHNIVDTILGRLPKSDRKRLRERYAAMATDADALPFLDRMAAESRGVAMHRTAGLATPVQAQMAFFSLFVLMDGGDAYKKALKRLLRQRGDLLYKGFGGQPPQDPDDAGYYRLLDLEAIYRQSYGEEFVQWLSRSLKPGEALLRIMGESGVVLSPLESSGSIIPSLRICLACLKEVEYRRIGAAVAEIGREFYERFRKPTKIGC